MIGYGTKLARLLRHTFATCLLVLKWKLRCPARRWRCWVGTIAPQEARFYVSPGAVQRTEVYEAQKHSKGASANLMIPFQGYKLIYAMLLADHGKLETAFKYVTSMLAVIKAVTATMKPGTSMYLEGMKNQLTVLDDRLRQHLGQDRVASVAASTGRGGGRKQGGKWGLGSALSIMGKIVNRVVEGTDSAPLHLRVLARRRPADCTRTRPLRPWPAATRVPHQLLPRLRRLHQHTRNSTFSRPRRPARTDLHRCRSTLTATLLHLRRREALPDPRTGTTELLLQRRQRDRTRGQEATPSLRQGRSPATGDLVLSSSSSRRRARSLEMGGLLRRGRTPTAARLHTAMVRCR